MSAPAPTVLVVDTDDTRPREPSPDRSADYEIRLRGRLDERWSTWFGDMTVDAETDGITVLRGSVPDQAALHGLLARLRDLGLPLISVTPVPAIEEPQ